MRNFYSKFFKDRLAQAPNPRLEKFLAENAEEVDASIRLNEYQLGYRSGVILINLDCTGRDLLASYGAIDDSVEVKAQYIPRVEGEQPRLSIRGRVSANSKIYADHCQVVLYHSTVLLEDESCPDERQSLEVDTGWRVVTVNLGTGKDPAPIHPDTLMHNHFHTDGGTNTGMTPKEFEGTLKESFLYWKDHVFYTNNSAKEEV